MKTILIIFLPLFTFISTTAQTSSWGNDDGYILFYSKFLNKIDTAHLNKGDVEVRLWYNDRGPRFYNTASFVSLTRKNDKWYASYYTFTYPNFPGGTDSTIAIRREPVKLNYDSLYKQLLNDGLLSLNSDTVNELMDKKGQRRENWFDAGPTNYTIQIVTNDKRQTTNFRCPRYFFNEVKIAEFEFPLKVISAILKVTGLNEPC